jgi:hypothetical protein
LTHGKWSSFLRLPAFMSHLSELDYDFTLCFTHNWLLALCQLFLRYPFLANDRSLAEVGKQTFRLKSANRKSANSWSHSAIANPKLSEVCQSANRKRAHFHDLSANRKTFNFYTILHNSVSKSSEK